MMGVHFTTGDKAKEPQTDKNCVLMIGGFLCIPMQKACAALAQAFCCVQV